MVQRLDKRVTALLRASLADRTFKQYGCAAGQFLMFCVWVYGAEPYCLRMIGCCVGIWCGSEDGGAKGRILGCEMGGS